MYQTLIFYTNYLKFYLSRQVERAFTLQPARGCVSSHFQIGAKMETSLPDNELLLVCEEVEEDFEYNRALEQVEDDVDFDQALVDACKTVEEELVGDVSE